MVRTKIDYLNLSLWDVTKEPEEEAFRGATLLSHFTTLPRGQARLVAAGKIMSGRTAQAMLDAGCDFAAIGRAAIMRHDFPERVRADRDYDTPAPPYAASHLPDEGISSPFLTYLRTWPDFIAD